MKKANHKHSELREKPKEEKNHGEGERSFIMSMVITIGFS